MMLRQGRVVQLSNARLRCVSAVAYRSADGLGRDHSEPWEFTCPRCGIDFTMPDDELIFQSVPNEWLFSGV